MGALRKAWPQVDIGVVSVVEQEEPVFLQSRQPSKRVARPGRLRNLGFNANVLEIVVDLRGRAGINHVNPGESAYVTRLQHRDTA